MTEYAKRIDENHPLIREYIRDRRGYTWIDTFRYGGGFPDAMVIARNGLLIMFEIKTSGEDMNVKERDFKAKLNEAGYHFYFVIHSIEEAESALAYVELFSLEVKR